MRLTAILEAAEPDRTKEEARSAPEIREGEK